MQLDIPPPFDAAWFLFALGFIIGSTLGSFGTMLAHRLPRHMSIVFPRSHCPSCNTPLGVRDLIPIVSWLSTQGHCRHCNAKIGAKYLYIELSTSLACGLASALIGISPTLLIAYAVILAVVVTTEILSSRHR